MADDDALIASLRGEGQSSGGGAFSLDPVRAREKLREFQLADPHRYVLLLIQAMVLRGATRVDVDVDTDDLRMSSDAGPFGLDELTELYALLFADGTPGPGLRELALALNSAMATDPRWVRVESGGAPDGEGARLEQRNDQPDQVERVGGAAPGVRVHVREKFRLGLIRRFFALGSDVVREQILVREHCRFARIEITLNRKAIARRTADDGVRSWHRVAIGEHVLGEIGLSAVGDKGRLELVRHQVWLCSHTLDDPQLAGVRGVIDVSHLRTDASMADVVRDDRYAAMLDAVRITHDLALAAACRADAACDGVLLGPVREVLCRRIGAYLAGPDPQPDAEPLRDYLRVALWHTVGGERRTSAQLLLEPQVRYSSVDAQPAPTEVAGMVYAKGRALALLLAAFGDRATDGTPEVGRAVIRAGNRRAFGQRLHTPWLPGSRQYERTRTIDGPGLQGAIGWAPNAGPSWIRIIIDHHLLVEIPFSPPLSTIHVVVGASFTPTDLFDDVGRDGTFIDAMHRAMVAFAALVRDICDALVPTLTVTNLVAEDLLRYMIEVAHGSLAAKWLADVGVSTHDIAAVCKRLGDPFGGELARDASGDLEHPLASLSLFEDAAQEPINLHRISLALRTDGAIRVITTSRPRLAHPPVFVARVGTLRLAMLEALFGKSAVLRVGGDYEKWIAREAFVRDRAPQPLQLGLACILGPLEFIHAGEPGLIGLAQDPPNTAGTSVNVLVGGRPIPTLSLGPTLRGVAVVLALPERFLSDACDGLSGPGLDAAEQMLAVGLGNLLDHLLDPTTTLTPRLRATILEAIRLACPAPAYVETWAEFSREFDDDTRLGHYLELLALGDNHPPSAVLTTVQSFIARRQTPRPDKIRDALARQQQVTSSWSTARAAAAKRLPRLLATALLPTGQGSLTPMQPVVDAVALGSWGYLPAGIDAPAAFAGVVRLDDDLRATLTRLLGAAKINDLSPQVERAQQRLKFEAREPLADLTLPADATLASIVVELDGIRGVLAIPRTTQPEARGKLTVTHLRRPITDIDATPGTGWVGILDGDAFGAESDFEGITRRELDRIVEIVELHRPMMIVALCANGLDGALGNERRVWVQHLLGQVLPLAEPTRAALEAAGVAAVANVPLFVAADGTPLRLNDVRAEQDRYESIATVRRAGLRTNRLLVLVRDDTEYRLLSHLFDELVDAEPLAARREAFERRLKDAQPLMTAPSDALAVVEIDGKGLSGALWITSDPDPTIALGIDGRTASQWRGSRMFPCAGAITGEAVVINDDFTDCGLSRSREETVKSRAAALYIRLVASLERPHPTADDPRIAVLSALVLRLYEIHRANRKWPSHEMRRLFRDLRDVALLKLANGRLISLRAAEKARPPELIALLDGSERGGRPAIDRDDMPPAPPPATVAHPVPAIVTPAPQDVPAPPRQFFPAPPVVVELPVPTAVAPPPEPPPPPIAPSPTKVLRDRIIAELRLVHRRDMSVALEDHLDGIRVELLDGDRVAACVGPHVIVDPSHPIVERALAQDADPLLVSLVVSAALTVLNAVSEAVTDADEARLLRLHAEHLLTVGAGAPHPNSTVLSS